MAARSDEARQAVLDTLDEMKATLGQATDYKVWTRKHPWVAVGVAAAAGFAAAAAVTPRRDQAVDEKLAALASLVGSTDDESPRRRHRQRRTMTQSVISSVFDLASTAATSFVLATLQSKFDQYNQPQPGGDQQVAGGEAATAGANV